MIIVNLVCNGCGGRIVPDAKNTRSAIMLLRHVASKSGWLHQKYTGNDYCPDCVKRLTKPITAKGVV